jgi:hypothetical protein
MAHPVAESSLLTGWKTVTIFTGVSLVLTPATQPKTE